LIDVLFVRANKDRVACKSHLDSPIERSEVRLLCDPKHASAKKNKKEAQRLQRRRMAYIGADGGQMASEVGAELLGIVEAERNREDLNDITVAGGHARIGRTRCHLLSISIISFVN
jgi:hypothetical protein